jgi:hypothetical protein
MPDGPDQTPESPVINLPLIKENTEQLDKNKKTEE